MKNETYKRCQVCGVLIPKEQFTMHKKDKKECNVEQAERARKTMSDVLQKFF